MIQRRGVPVFQRLNGRRAISRSTCSSKGSPDSRAPPPCSLTPTLPPCRCFDYLPRWRRIDPFQRLRCEVDGRVVHPKASSGGGGGWGRGGWLVAPLELYDPAFVDSGWACVGGGVPCYRSSRPVGKGVVRGGVDRQTEFPASSSLRSAISATSSDGVHISVH